MPPGSLPQLLDDGVLADSRWPGDDKNPRTPQRPQVTDQVVGVLAKMIARDRLDARELPIWSRVAGSLIWLHLNERAAFRPGVRHARPRSGPRGPIRERLYLPDPYDVLTIAAIVDELSATIGNGRIQRIGLLDPRTIGAEIYAGGHRHYVIASANDSQPRLRLAPEMPSLDSALMTPFGLLLRKHIRGGIILGVDQPPLERLVRFSIAKRLVPLKTRRNTTEPDMAEIELDGSMKTMS